MSHNFKQRKPMVVLLCRSSIPFALVFLFAAISAASNGNPPMVPQEVIDYFSNRSQTLQCRATLIFWSIVGITVLLAGGFATFLVTSVKSGLRTFSNQQASVGVAGLAAILFFYQLLVSLYEYNIRVAEHHAAVAQALNIKTDSVNDLATLVNALAPGVEFKGVPEITFNPVSVTKE